MSRAVDRDAPLSGGAHRLAPPVASPSASRLSSRSVTVQHGASRLRHLPGDRHRRGGRDPAVSARARGRRAAAGDVEIHFNHTDFSFLQSAPFLLAMLVGAIAARRWSSAGCRPSARAPARRCSCLAAASRSALGALFFAGSLCRGHYVDLAGHRRRRSTVRAGRRSPPRARCCARARAGSTSARPSRCRCSPRRSALLLAVLSVVAPPVGPIAPAAAAVAAVAGRGREDQKYAGLRILR